MKLFARATVAWPGWLVVVAVAGADEPRHDGARQLTHAPGGHVLTNSGGWSPDGRWLVHDVRAGSEFDGTRIEQVEVATGAMQLLYESRAGAGCGMSAYNPVAPRIVFVLGPENPGPDWSYGVTRRRSVLLETSAPGIIRALDAMNYAPPFTPGALRGGSHLPQFSGDGAWLSFTYDDDVLARLGDEAAHDNNQRNVAVAVPAGPVTVARSHPRNHDGEYFSVVVSATMNRPRPGSDEISRAFEEGWVGREGYLKADGARQRRALAFLGTVTRADGGRHEEVFIVDLPEDLTVAGVGPLAGTDTRRPAPPQGVIQRRLTFTGDRPHPGAVTTPRHWVRCSPDGAAIAFLMKDDSGVVQLWTVSPRGDAPQQITYQSSGVTSAFNWSPNGRWIAHTMDRSVFATEVATGNSVRLTLRRADEDAPLPRGCLVSPNGRWVAYGRPVAGEGFLPQIFVVAMPTW